MGTRGSRTQFIEGSLLSCGQGVSVHLDICGRISTCRICGNALRSGDTRLCVGTRGAPRAMANGGTAFKLQKFYHPECFIRYIAKFADLLPQKEVVTADEVEEELNDFGEFLDNFNFSGQRGGKVCVDCGTDPGVTHKRVRVSSRYWREPLCLDCFRSGRWVECFCCGCMVHKYLLSPSTDARYPNKVLICDLCSENQDISTIKTNNARRRRAQKIEAKFEGLKEVLEERYAQED